MWLLISCHESLLINVHYGDTMPMECVYGRKTLIIIWAFWKQTFQDLKAVWTDAPLTWAVFFCDIHVPKAGTGERNKNQAAALKLAESRDAAVMPQPVSVTPLVTHNGHQPDLSD